MKQTPLAEINLCSVSVFTDIFLYEVTVWKGKYCAFHTEFIEQLVIFEIKRMSFQHMVCFYRLRCSTANKETEIR